MTRNYNDPQYSQFRKDVLIRDKFKCRMPGCKNNTMLHVHHIKPWSKAHALRYHITNGITLCKNCHKLITNKEHFYEKLFLEIINE